MRIASKEKSMRKNFQMLMNKIVRMKYGAGISCKKAQEKEKKPTVDCMVKEKVAHDNVENGSYKSQSLIFRWTFQEKLKLKLSKVEIKTSAAVVLCSISKLVE